MKLHRWFEKGPKNENIHIMYVLTVMFYISNLNEYLRPLRPDVCVFGFGTFLKPSTQLQTTGSPRLLNGFRCFLVQNEGEILLDLFLSSTVHFC